MQDAGCKGQKAEGKGQDAGCKRQDAGGRGQEAGGRMQEAGGKRQDARSRRQEARGKRREAGGRRQDARSRRQEARGRRQGEKAADAPLQRGFSGPSRAFVVCHCATCAINKETPLLKARSPRLGGASCTLAAALESRTCSGLLTGHENGPNKLGIPLLMRTGYGIFRCLV